MVRWRIIFWTRGLFEKGGKSELAILFGIHSTFQPNFWDFFFFFSQIFWDLFWLAVTDVNLKTFDIGNGKHMASGSHRCKNDKKKKIVSD